MQRREDGAGVGGGAGATGRCGVAEQQIADRRKSATREQFATIKVAHAQQQRVATQRLAAPVDG